MKKLLSLIGALTLVGTASAPVIACSDTTNPAKDLINKLKGANITVPIGTPTAIWNSKTQTAIRNALKAAKSLTQPEANELSFSGTKPLVAGQQINITVTATVSGQAATGTIEVTLTVNPAQTLIDKVNGAYVTVPAGTPSAISDPQTQTAIRASLKNDKGLSSKEASELSFSGSNPLAASQPINVTVTANVSGHPATGTIDVTLAINPAQTLIDKVKGAQIKVPMGTPPAISDPKTQIAIRTDLATAKRLTPQEASELIFSGSNPLVAGQPVQVTVTAVVSEQAATGTIEVTLAKTTPNKAQKILDKITNKNVVLPSAIPWTDKTKYPDTSNATIKNDIMQMLKINNTDLTDNDLTKLSLSKTTLLPSTDVTVGLTAKVDGDSATMDIKVKWNISKAEIIIAKITKKDLTVPVGTNPNVTNQATITAIKTALKKANPNLLQSDLSALTFTAAKPLSTTAIPVTAVANVEGESASITLQVQIAS